jgi:hypothetical protein
MSVRIWSPRQEKQKAMANGNASLYLRMVDIRCWQLCQTVISLSL